MSPQALDCRALDARLAGLCDAPHWYVGLSGGVDSTVLLHLIRDWRAAHPGAPPLTAIHVNHALQPAAPAWQAHCERLCRHLQIPLLARRVAVREGGRGPEAAAREARYRLFESVLGPGEILFLGHHLDDQVETFLLRLMRGAGLQGLSAMPARRPLGAGHLVRPLLRTTRAQLEEYASRRDLACVSDPSNSDTALDRNFLRAEVLPLLATRWPGYRSTVARAGEHLAAAASALRSMVPPPARVRSALGDPGLALAQLDGLPSEEAALLLRDWLRAGGLAPPARSTLAEFLRQLRECGAQASPALRCSAYTLQRFRDGVYLLPPPAPAPRTACALQPGGRTRLAGVGTVSLEPAVVEGLLLAPGERPLVSWRRGGERCRPVGRGGSHSLKKLLQEYHVPPWWRERVPLLCLEGEMLSAGGLWYCASGRWREAGAGPGYLWRLRWQPATHPGF
jgi:tRNA(Ile)-lysidine synthase